MNKLLLTLLCLPFFSFSQEKTPESKLDFGVYILPEMNGLITRNPIGSETTRAKLGGSAGLNLEVHLSQKLSLRTGLGYGWKRYDHLHEGLIFNSDIDPQSGVQSDSRMESSMVYCEIQLPLLLQYKVTSAVFFTLGLELNAAFANQSERTIYYGNGQIEALENTTGTTMNYAPTISVGYVVPDANLLIEPMFKYDLKQYIVPESNHYNYGIKVTYNFRR